jgi:hypothetical protein
MNINLKITKQIVFLKKIKFKIIKINKNNTIQTESVKIRKQIILDNNKFQIQLKEEGKYLLKNTRLYLNRLSLI